ANAITLLTAIQVPFIGRYGNLSDVHISGADLTGALLDHANLQGANLRSARLARAFLREADLRHADLQEVDWGELPGIKTSNSINSISYSPDGKCLAIATNKNIELWEVDSDKTFAILEGDTRPV